MLGLFEVGMVIGAILFFGSFIPLFIMICFEVRSRESGDRNGKRSDFWMAFALRMVCAGMAIGGISLALWLCSGGWDMIIEALSKGELTNEQTIFPSYKQDILRCIYVSRSWYKYI